jgi:lipopolysaccharide export system protein LptA
MDTNILKRMARIVVLAAAVTAPAVSAQNPDGSVTNSTLINSKSMTFDNQTRTAVFQGDVIVVDPSLKMLADTMTVVFDAANNPETITATGSVKIWQVDRIAVCKKAVYSVKSGLLVLTGNPVLTRAGDRMIGSRIIFKRDEEKVTGENVSIQFTPSQTNDIGKMFGK